jgi:hypothetical protein
MRSNFKFCLVIELECLNSYTMLTIIFGFKNGYELINENEIRVGDVWKPWEVFSFRI